MQITNQKPAVLVPHYTPDIFTDDYDVEAYVLEAMAAPLYQPITAGQPVLININNTNITADDVTNNICMCLGDTIDVTAETATKTLYAATLADWKQPTTLAVTDTFAIQAAARLNMPEPSPTCIYTPSVDVIPAAKHLLAGTSSPDELFVSLDFFARPKTLGIRCTTSQDFEDFKAWIQAQMALQTNPALPPDTTKLLNDFTTLTLGGLTESVLLRDPQHSNNQAMSFARTIMAYILEYAQTNPDAFGIFAFNTAELFCPTSLVFINVEQHAHATARQVNKEWDVINQAITSPVKMVSNKKLSKLTATVRNTQKAQQHAHALQSKRNKTGDLARSAKVAFTSKSPTVVDMTKRVKRIIDKLSDVAKSSNVYKTSKLTFARPNRRNPDDFNKPGKTFSTKYKPDIHLYVDTSGSISEENYEDAIKACIRMAKKLNVDLYFNSFSHHISQCTKLNTKDRSFADIYKQFQRIDKVDGGTEYANVWNYIQSSKKRRAELSLMITDFEYNVPSHYIKHPRNLYYFPISQANYKEICHWATSFCQGMQHNDPTIRKHLLF